MIDEVTTAWIHLTVKYILRYLFHLQIGFYDELKANGRLDRLKHLTCYRVPSIKVEYRLMGELATAPRNVCLDEGNLYVDASKEGDSDLLAIELARMLGNPPGLEDFLMLAFDRKSEVRIQELLAKRNIGELPPDELGELSIRAPADTKALIDSAIADARAEAEQEGELFDEFTSNATATENERREFSKISADEEGGLIGEPFDDEPIDAEGAEAITIELFTEAPAYAGHHEDPERVADQSARAPRPDGLKTPDGISGGSRTGKASDFSAADSQNRSRPPRPVRTIPPEETTLLKTETPRWQAECEPEDAQVRVEQFEATRRRFRNSRSVEANRPQASSTVGAVHSEADQFSDGLTLEDKQKIGRWGEGYAIKYLREQLVKKHPGAELQTIYDGFNIWQEERMLVQVRWLNRVADTGTGHDIKVTDDGREFYIEVKTTKTEGKEWFDVSRRQWEFAELHQDNFYIYRVLSAGTYQASLIEIHNPFDQWSNGHLVAHPVRVFI